MRRQSVILIFILALSAVSFRPAQDTSAPLAPPAQEVKWLSWEEAMELSLKEKKKIFLDVYTDWCGWCKRMDQTTFKDQQVASFLNDNFYPIKLNAEQRADITYQGKVFKFRDVGRRGVHELAYSLLDGKLGYPSYVYLNEKQERIAISPGYKPADQMLQELKRMAQK